MDARKQRFSGFPIRLLLLLLLVVSVPEMIAAQQDTTPAVAKAAQDPAPNANSAPEGFFDIVFSGGLTGFLIVLLLLSLSICAAALVIEHIMSIRASVLMPVGLAEQVQAQLLENNVPNAIALCQQRPSFLAFVLQAGIAEVDGGWTTVEKAMEDAAAEQSARLFRKIEYLSVIANIAPMLGLLGTVIGMIFAFQEVATSQGQARVADLAHGIYQALVTTVGGLLVAIPALAAFAIFRNRVDQLVAESSYAAQHVFVPLKRRRTQRRSPSGGDTAPPPPPPT